MRWHGSSRLLATRSSCGWGGNARWMAIRSSPTRRSPSDRARGSRAGSQSRVHPQPAGESRHNRIQATRHSADTDHHRRGCAGLARRGRSTALRERHHLQRRDHRSRKPYRSRACKSGPGASCTDRLVGGHRPPGSGAASTAYAPTIQRASGRSSSDPDQARAPSGSRSTRFRDRHGRRSSALRPSGSSAIRKKSRSAYDCPRTRRIRLPASRDTCSGRRAEPRLRPPAWPRSSPAGR